MAFVRFLIVGILLFVVQSSMGQYHFDNCYVLIQYIGITDKPIGSHIIKTNKELTIKFHDSNPFDKTIITDNATMAVLMANIRSYGKDTAMKSPNGSGTFFVGFFNSGRIENSVDTRSPQSSIRYFKSLRDTLISGRHDPAVVEAVTHYFYVLGER